MRNVLRSLIAPVLTVLLVGCGSSDDAADLPPDAGNFDAIPNGLCEGKHEISLGAAAACYRAAMCDVKVRCWGSYDSVDACMDSGDGSADILSLFRRTIDAINAGRQGFDGATAPLCFELIRAESCTALQQLDQDLPDTMECQAMFGGLVGDGGECFSDGDCIDDDFCDRSGECTLQCCPGLCQPRAGFNESCENQPCIHSPYEQDYCADTPDDGKICQGGATGSWCGSDADCREGFWCDTSAGNPGQCADAALPGGPCTSDSQCAYATCVGDDTSAGTGTCATVETFSVPCDDTCYGPYYCTAVSGELGECAPLPIVGDSCAVSGRCLGQLSCDPETSSCVERVPLNGACTETQQCKVGLFCTSELPDGSTSGKCVGRREDGKACNDRRQCSSNICNSAGICEAYQNCYE